MAKKTVEETIKSIQTERKGFKSLRVIRTFVKPKEWKGGEIQGEFSEIFTSSYKKKTQLNITVDGKSFGVNSSIIRQLQINEQTNTSPYLGVEITVIWHGKIQTNEGNDFNDFEILVPEVE